MVWMGFAFMPLFLLGFGVIAGFIPPPSPGDSAEEVARMFDDDRTRIRIGMWVTTAAAALLACFVTAISLQLRRMEGPGVGPLATLQAVSGALVVLEFIFPQMAWQTAAYRSERSPETIQMLNDIAWLCYLGVVSTFLLQCFAIVLATFRDTRADPVFPRWMAYVTIWSALGVSGGSMVVFTRSGPFAWNGVIAWWLLVVAFFVWMVATTWALLRAIRQEEREAEPERPPVAQRETVTA